MSDTHSIHTEDVRQVLGLLAQRKSGMKAAEDCMAAMRRAEQAEIRLWCEVGYLAGKSIAERVGDELQGRR